MALLILKYCSPRIAVLFHLPSIDLDFLSLFFLPGLGLSVPAEEKPPLLT